MSATEYVLELRSRKEIENHDRGRKGEGDSLGAQDS